MDKVQKIREEVERIQLYTQSEVLKQVLVYIDKVQEVPVVDTQSPVILYGLTGSVGFTKEEPVSHEQVKESAKIQHVDKMCKENGNSLTQEPVSEDLEEAAIDYDSCRPALYGEDDEGDYVEYIEVRKDAFIAGADWQKEKMMKDAIDVKVKVDAGGYPYIPQMELYDYDKDVPLAKAGEKVKVIVIIKE